MLSEQKGGTWHVTSSHNEPLNSSGIPPTNYTPPWLPCCSCGHPSIHPFIFLLLYSVSGLGGSSSSRDVQTSLGPISSSGGNRKAFPRPAERCSPSSVSRVFSRSAPSGRCPEHLSREACRRHPEQMPQPPQLVPLNVEEQQNLSK